MTIILKKGTISKDLDKTIEKTTPQKKLNAKKYLGSIKLNKDALEIQKEMRNEWN